MTYLLSIIIPTYNRANCLELLLESLKCELKGLENRVEVIIGDNASEDGTALLSQDFKQHWHATQIIRHTTNLGADENFCHCIEHCDSQFFWILGDDDLPRAGAIPLLVELLVNYDPDIVYMNSHWRETLTSHKEIGQLLTLQAMGMGRREFARRVHVWTTFISGCIIRRKHASVVVLRQFSGSALVQLGWIFAALQQGQKFIHVASTCVLATSANSGGYAVLKVFGNNFPQITREALSQNSDQRAMAEEIISRTSISFLPGLIWGFRQGKAGDFDQDESVVSNLENQLGSSLIYRFIILPLSTAKPLTAKFLLVSAIVIYKLIVLVDHFRARLAGCNQVA